MNGVIVFYRLPETVSFNNYVCLIISDKRYACHDPDVANQKKPFPFTHARKLSTQSSQRMYAPCYRIVPSKREESIILEHIVHQEPILQMPPPEAKKPSVTIEEYAILKRWIKEVAYYETHWAFATPEKPILSQIIQKDWIRNPIDQFILSMLEEKGIHPSP